MTRAASGRASGLAIGRRLFAAVWVALMTASVAAAWPAAAQTLLAQLAPAPPPAAPAAKPALPKPAVAPGAPKAVGPAAPKAAAPAPAAAWQPSKPIEFVVMAGPGGGADQAVRFLVDVIAKQGLAKVPFTVVNEPGRSGGDALAKLQARTGDDHVILFTLNSFYTTPLDMPDLKIDVARFTPIARLAEDVFLLWVNSERADIKTIDDFVKAAKAKGKGWVMAGTGKGAEDQLLTEFLNATYGLDMTYKSFGGGGEVAKELAEKRADSTVNNPAEQNNFYPKGMTKPIVAFTPARLPAYIATPTLRETGMDFTYFMQRSVVGAPRMSPGAASWYDKLFRSLFDSPQWKDYATRNSLGGALLTGQSLMGYWVKEREKHARWKMAIELMKP
ncbi:MAG: tripartite tricarboxylate transporter substrate-binding protein [Hyphomicrobium sp.]